jgi:CDGSH-type Zn-finger protein
MPGPGPQPLVVDLQEGVTYAWCRCGRSANQPFCDGSQGTGTGPTCTEALVPPEAGCPGRPIVFVARRNERAWLCVCKQSRRAPFCDGTHNKLDKIP